MQDMVEHSARASGRKKDYRFVVRETASYLLVTGGDKAETCIGEHCKKVPNALTQLQRRSKSKKNEEC